MGRRLNRAAIARLLRLCDVLDADPRLWLVYGDTFRLFLGGARDDLDRLGRTAVWLVCAPAIDGMM